MAPQRGQPQERTTNRPLTRSRTRHFVWSLGWCGPHQSQKWRGSQESNLSFKGGTPRCWCRHTSSGACQTIPWKPDRRVSPKNQPKRSSFMYGNKQLIRQCHARLPQSTLPFFLSDMSEPWLTDVTDIKVHTTVPSLSDGDTQDVTGSPPSPWLWLLRGVHRKSSLTLTMTAERCPQEVLPHPDYDCWEVSTGSPPSPWLWLLRGVHRKSSLTLTMTAERCPQEVLPHPDYDCWEVSTGSPPSPWLWLLRGVHRKYESMYSPMG